MVCMWMKGDTNPRAVFPSYRIKCLWTVRWRRAVSNVADDFEVQYRHFMDKRGHKHSKYIRQRLIPVTHGLATVFDTCLTFYSPQASSVLLITTVIVHFQQWLVRYGVGYGRVAPIHLPISICSITPTSFCWTARKNIARLYINRSYTRTVRPC